MLQPVGQSAGEAVDRRNLERQADVGDLRDELDALLDQRRGMSGKLHDRTQ